MREYRDYWESQPGGLSGGRSFRFGLGLTSVVKALMIGNGAVFLGLVILRNLSDRWGWAILDAGWQSRVLGLVPAEAVEHLHLWQFGTYMFLHADLMHLLFNLLMLYFMGTLCERRLGSRRFLQLYLGAGLFGGLCYVLFSYFGDPWLPVVGASGAVMGVTIAAAILYPDLQVLFMFIFPLRMRTLALILVGIDLYMFVFEKNSPVASSAHLGGAFFGFLFLRYIGSVTRWFGRVEREIAVKDEERGVKTREQVDDLLDKIHREGISNLSRKEKNFLKRASQEYRERDG
jgi:membrane associated rhomboid family serine protease